MNTLLLYGSDLELLQTRRWVLEAQGYDVIAITEVGEMEDISGPIILLILCHTVPAHDCSFALAKASARWPGIRELVLVALGATACSEGNERFFTADGPEKLLTLVERIVPQVQALA